MRSAIRGFGVTVAVLMGLADAARAPTLVAPCGLMSQATPAAARSAMKGM
jgi:hypothetical protein